MTQNQKMMTIFDSESEDSFDGGLNDTESINDDMEVVMLPPCARPARVKAASVSYAIEDTSSESKNRKRQ